MLADLKRAEERAEREGWSDADDIEEELGILEEVRGIGDKNVFDN